MSDASKRCTTSPTGCHELEDCLIGFDQTWFDHARCKWCGQTSYLRLDGTFAWEGFRGLEPKQVRR